MAGLKGKGSMNARSHARTHAYSLGMSFHDRVRLLGFLDSSVGRFRRPFVGFVSLLFAFLKHACRIGAEVDHDTRLVLWSVVGMNECV